MIRKNFFFKLTTYFLALTDIHSQESTFLRSNFIINNLPKVNINRNSISIGYSELFKTNKLATKLNINNNHILINFNTNLIINNKVNFVINNKLNGKVINFLFNIKKIENKLSLQIGFILGKGIHLGLINEVNDKDIEVHTESIMSSMAGNNDNLLISRDSRNQNEIEINSTEQYNEEVLLKFLQTPQQSEIDFINEYQKNLENYYNKIIENGNNDFDCLITILPIAFSSFTKNPNNIELLKIKREKFQEFFQEFIKELPNIISNTIISFKLEKTPNNNLIDLNNLERDELVKEFYNQQNDIIKNFHHSNDTSEVSWLSNLFFRVFEEKLKNYPKHEINKLFEDIILIATGEFEGKQIANYKLKEEEENIIKNISEDINNFKLNIAKILINTFIFCQKKELSDFFGKDISEIDFLKNILIEEKKFKKLINYSIVLKTYYLERSTQLPYNNEHLTYNKQHDVSNSLTNTILYCSLIKHEFILKIIKDVVNIMKKKDNTKLIQSDIKDILEIIKEKYKMFYSNIKFINKFETHKSEYRVILKNIKDLLFDQYDLNLQNIENLSFNQYNSKIVILSRVKEYFYAITNFFVFNSNKISMLDKIQIKKIFNKSKFPTFTIENTQKNENDFQSSIRYSNQNVKQRKFFIEEILR